MKVFIIDLNGKDNSIIFFWGKAISFINSLMSGYLKLSEGGRLNLYLSLD